MPCVTEKWGGTIHVYFTPKGGGGRGTRTPGPVPFTFYAYGDINTSADGRSFCFYTALCSSAGLFI